VKILSHTKIVGGTVHKRTKSHIVIITGDSDIYQTGLRKEFQSFQEGELVWIEIAPNGWHAMKVHRILKFNEYEKS